MKYLWYWHTLGGLLYILTQHIHLLEKVHFKEQQHAFPHALSELFHAHAVTATRVSNDLHLGWMVESINSDYLKKRFPWHFLIALHRISKIILKRPEFSIQVIIYWNGTVEKKKKKEKTLYWKAIHYIQVHSGMYNPRKYHSFWKQISESVVNCHREI